jgi:hypothetical protein
MSYVLCFGYCAACRKMLGFNPMKVPSIRIAGKREPICKECVDMLNQRLVANDHQPVAILPGAYEACDEFELEEVD